MCGFQHIYGKPGSLELTLIIYVYITVYMKLYTVHSYFK